MAGILTQVGSQLLVAVPYGGRLHLYEQRTTAPDHWHHAVTSRAAHDFVRAAIRPPEGGYPAHLHVVTRDAAGGPLMHVVGVLGGDAGSGPQWLYSYARPEVSHAEVAPPPEVPSSTTSPRPFAVDRFECVDGQLRTWLGELQPFGGYAFREFTDATNGHARLPLPADTLGIACCEVGFLDSAVVCHAVVCDADGLSHFSLAYDGAAAQLGTRRWMPVVHSSESLGDASPRFATTTRNGSWGAPVLVHDRQTRVSTLVAPLSVWSERHPHDDRQIRLVRFTLKEGGRFEYRPTVRYPLGSPGPDPWSSPPTVLGVRVDTTHFGAVQRRDGKLEVVAWAPSTTTTDPLAPSQALRRWVVDGDVWMRKTVLDD